MSSTADSQFDVDAIARGYLRYADALGSEEYDSESMLGPEWKADERAYDEVEYAIGHGPPERAWDLVTTLLRLSADERLDVHAAGPLENLVRRWGVALMDRIESLASRDERFRWALGCVWIKQSGELPPEIVRRIVAASGDVIKPLDS